VAHFLHIYLINRKNNAGHRHWFGLTQAVIQAVTLRYHPFSVTSYGYNQTLWPAYSTSSIIPQKKRNKKKPQFRMVGMEVTSIGSKIMHQDSISYSTPVDKFISFLKTSAFISRRENCFAESAASSISSVSLGTEKSPSTETTRIS